MENLIIAQPVTTLDIPGIAKLQPEGWSDITLAFGDYLAHAFCYPFVYKLDDELIGVGSLISFGRSGWLGHIIVHPSRRGKGVGGYIVNHLIQLAHQLKIETLSLIATSMGENIYKKAGFRVVADYQYFERSLTQSAQTDISNIVLFESRYYQSLVALDRFITGEKRDALLQEHTNGAMLIIDKGVLQGYYLPTLGEGPVYALTPSAGILLLDVRISGTSKAVVPAGNMPLEQYFLSEGFESLGVKGRRMVLGPEIAWRPECFFQRIGGNYG